MSRRSSGSDSGGYALPLVLIGIAVLLVLAGASASRVTREARITKLEENGEQALYAAEAGFNRVRSLAVKCGGNPDALDEVQQALTYTDESNTTREAGRYTLKVDGVAAGSWRVTSVGTFGAEPFAAMRVVSGRIDITKKKPDKGPCSYNVVKTTYTSS